MSPDVLSRKLERLTRLLDDLESHRGRTGAEVETDPYAVERLLELLVQVGVDIVAHLLAGTGLTAPSYRGAFELAGKAGILPDQLAARLADAAGLRNILVHLYEEVDYEIVAASIGPALEDFSELRRVMEVRLRQMEAEAQDDA